MGNAPFGIWLDIGARIPGILKIPYLSNHIYLIKYYPNWMPEIGIAISAKVVYLQDRERLMSQICLQQVSSEEKKMQISHFN